MNALNSLDRLRLQGLRILLFANWIGTITLGLGGLLLGLEHTGRAMLLSVLINALPTIQIMCRRRDLEVRLAIGTLAMGQPAIGLYLLSGHHWQMDGHMFFFVAMAGLTLLYDWRPILLGAVLIALHHLVLSQVAPDWVFPDGANLGRVFVHGAAVATQAAVLCYLTARLRTMLLALEDHVARSGELARQAEDGRLAAEAAMAASRDADARAAQVRDQQAAEKARMTAERQAATLALARDFRRSVAEIVDAVGASTQELDHSARQLNHLARRASAGTEETVAIAEQSSTNAAILAQRIEQLSQSITAIALAAHQQATLGEEAQRVSSTGHQAMCELEGRTTSITSFADSITQIAARTNLLALNATIEAARAGDVGRGFAVVAGEVKQLAGQAANATGEIQTLAWSARQGAGVAQAALSDVAGAVQQLAETAGAIQRAVADQRDATAAIGQSARDTANGAAVMTRQMEDVADVARDNETLSSRVSIAASDLSRTAQDLQRAADLFVAQLEAA
ncbi:methyl-accepting chemotaxis protein [Sphingobium sp. HBC34]|uniref:Methyl-accepting chemotaxis protein n=1 Tax=Sphingobium cyanobacteriorum TaxID=3063954 RepID=A0ABT8ZNF5_9SPHN|nr:methyl-accepting chemotaxis protein [Sphingobium sp. HBC34]MDO7836053.1 methyl-accepting chemotaxis protein [Sphingobium sp. HBC34]